MFICKFVPILRKCPDCDFINLGMYSKLKSFAGMGGRVSCYCRTCSGLGRRHTMFYLLVMLCPMAILLRDRSENKLTSPSAYINPTHPIGTSLKEQKPCTK